MPTLENEVVKCLIRYIYPTITDEDLNEKMSFRHRMKVDFKTCLSVETLAANATELMGEDGCSELLADTKAYMKRLEASKLATPAPKAAAKAVARKRKVHEKDLLGLLSAQKYLPPQAGCTLSMQSEWHSRWRCQYPNEFPPFSTSASFEDKDPASKRTAFFKVLSWAWTMHENEGLGRCPYDFSIV